MFKTVLGPRNGQIHGASRNTSVADWLPQIRVAHVKSKANFVNYVFCYLGDIEVQEFCRLAGDSASTALIARQFLFFPN
jgi:hypothetical protein